MVKPTPGTVTAKTCPQIIDTISFIRSLRIRFTTNQSIPCYIHKIKHQNHFHYTLSHSSQNHKSNKIKFKIENADTITFLRGLSTGDSPFRRRIRLRPFVYSAVPFHCTDQTRLKRVQSGKASLSQNKE